MSETEYIQLTFGKVMRFRRMQMGLTQEYLAEQMNVAQNTVSRWESMGDPPRNPYVLERLAELLRVEVDDLRTGRLRRARDSGGVRGELQRIAMEHAETPEEVQRMAAIMEAALMLNPEGLRRAEDYVSLVVEHFGRKGEDTEDERDPESDKTAM
jgi:transcriptional regulator with XRE-family HTH domain